MSMALSWKWPTFKSKLITNELCIALKVTGGFFSILMATYIKLLITRYVFLKIELLFSGFGIWLVLLFSVAR